MGDHNYAAAFIEFSKGTPTEQIAEALAIPLDSLKNKVRVEGWKKLAGDFALPAITTRPAERDLARIQVNREKNLALAEKLQADLSETIQKLVDGTLKIEKVMGNGVRAVVEPSIRDRLDLANYAKTVAELSYRALGDVVASREGAGEHGAAVIQIILPAPVATPRQSRAIDVESEVVTLEKPRFLRVVEAELVPSAGIAST